MEERRYVSVAAYDLTGFLLYGKAIRFPIQNGKMLMECLYDFMGPRLRLKDGTEILPDSSGYSNVGFPVDELVEICAMAPPACALRPICWHGKVQAPPGPGSGHMKTD